jgi:hypothetical protein
MQRSHALPRKKACSQCSAAKARCDLLKPTCSRCLGRGLHCSFLQQLEASTFPISDANQQHPVNAGDLVNPLTPSTVTSSHGSDVPDYGAQFPLPGSVGTPTVTPVRFGSPPSQPHGSSVAPDFARVTDLLSPVDFVRIRDRWLDFYFAPSDKKLKNYTLQTINLISRTLKSYARMWVRNSEHFPPFIHPLQWQAPTHESLSNCLSLLRMCFGRAPGSEKMVASCLENEMRALVQDVSLRNRLHSTRRAVPDERPS